MLVLEALGIQGRIPLSQWHLGIAAAVLGVTLIFVLRVVLFLQWIGFTRLRHAAMRGFFYLRLYYITAGIITLVAGAASTANFEYMVLGMFTPYSALMSEGSGSTVLPGILIGLLLQLILIVLLLRTMDPRLRRPALVPMLSEG
jgi:hypothetical protein